MQYAMTLDTDGDGLIDDAPGSESGFPANQYYDIWPWFGTSAYTAGIGLAALRAAEEMARDQGDPAFAAWCHERYARGCASFEDKLWNGTYYRLYNDFDHGRMSETSLVNQLCGQLHAWACGVGDIHPPANVLSALRTVGLRNARATRWGAVAGVKPDLTPDESGTSQSREVVVGETWNYAATALYATRGQADDSEIRAQALRAAENAYQAILQSGTLWNQHFSYGAADGNPVWGSHYYSNLCIWALPFALDARPAAP
jgi:non-lysosomal glucosylceramidase